MSSQQHRTQRAPASSPPAQAAQESPVTQVSNSLMQQQISQLQAGGSSQGPKVEITTDLLSMLGGGQDQAVDPSLDHEDRGSISYQEHEGQTFVQGGNDRRPISPNDVDQNGLGDCYLLAAMAAIARANPRAIRRLIRDNGDGTYDVTLYLHENFWDFTRSSHVETVSSSFPTNAEGKPEYAGFGDQGPGGPELWVMLIEKAFAQYEGGYEDIVGGNPGEAMEMLMVGEHTTWDTDDYSPERLGELIHQAMADGDPVTASTRKIAGMSASKKEEAEDVGIVGGHAYAIRGVNVGAQTISLQNPWGNSHIVGLSLSDFQTYFYRAQVLR